jgi:hypothetical protein
MDYQAFLSEKARLAPDRGFDPVSENPLLFDWQRDVVRLACRRGSFGGFEDCGLGKTAQQLECAAQFVKRTGKRVLILCPLAVAQQTLREAEKFNIDVQCKVVKSSGECEAGISITNYERLHSFDPTEFDGVIVDEGSILKSVDGKYRTMILESFQHCAFKQTWTATPAPNDHMEIGNQAEFIGSMKRSEMLSTYFVHDGGDTAKWRLKGHAKSRFWEWMASWAVCVRKPGDLGYSDNGFVLPALNYIHHEIGGGGLAGYLFDMPATTLDERRDAKKSTITLRCQHVANLVNASDEPWVIWCNYNDEGELLDKLIPDAVEVAGRHSTDAKEEMLTDFTRGRVRVLITKPKIGGFGLNWQHCHNTVIFPTDSWEQWYQMIRRFYRFGQKQAVNVHVVYSTGEAAIVSNLERKEADSHELFEAMAVHMSDLSKQAIRGVMPNITHYNADKAMELPAWLRKRSSVSTRNGQKPGRCTTETAAK